MNTLQFQKEEKHLRETMEQSRLRIQEFEERQRRIKQEPIEASEVSFDIQIALYIAISKTLHLF